MTSDLRPYPEMKDSGVGALGRVPAHWRVRKLGQIGRFSKGNGGSKMDDLRTGISCIRYGDLYTSHTYFIHQSRGCISRERVEDYTPISYGDVLFAASGETIEEIGKSAVNLIKDEAYCGGDIILFRPSIQAHPKFMGYATDFRPATEQKARMGRGFTVVHVYSDQLKRLAVPLPPLREQVSIVRFLANADRRIRRFIRAKEKLIALLEEQKQAIIHQAVTGRIDIRTGQSYPAYKPSRVEWMGEVPAEWQVLRFGRVISLTAGYPFKSENFTKSESDVRLLRGINVAPGRLRWDEVVRWSVADVDAYSEYQIEVGDIILGMDRPIIGSGIRVAVADENDVPSLLLQRVARIRPVKERLDREFALKILSSRNFLNYLAPIFTGISVPHLSPEQIRGFLIALPGITEQRAIVEYLTSRVKDVQFAAERAERQIDLLREYRTRLIADVVTGKLDVRKAAAALPEKPDELDAVEADFTGAEGGDESRPDCDWRTAVPATQEEMTP